MTQLAECLMRAGSANDALRRYGPVAELLGASAPAWPELDARLDVWLDTVREMGYLPSHSIITLDIDAARELMNEGLKGWLIVYQMLLTKRQDR